MNLRRKPPVILGAVVLCLVAAPGAAQTFQLGQEPQSKSGSPGAAAQPDGQALGFGSNIQNARLARAAELALQHGDHTLALTFAERAAQAAPNDPHLWLLVGYAARLSGRYGPAVEAYQRSLRLRPSVDGLSGLAQTYAVSGRTDEAERLLKQVVATDPGRRNDLVALSEIYVKSGDYGSAIDWLARAERIEPDAHSELLLAVSYQHLNKLDLASHFLELAKSRAPNNPDVDRSLAAFFRETGEYDKAVAALVSINNPKPDVVAELAYTYALGGKLDDSARVYMQAANLLPKDLNLQLSAAQAQVTVGAIEKASLFLQRAMQINPGYYRLHVIRGEIAQIQDREADAAREYQAAIAGLPAAPPEGPLYGIQLHLNLLALYQSLDDSPLALEQLTIAKAQISVLDERGSKRPAFLRLRALISLNDGQLQDAYKDMTESLALSPEDPNSLQLDGDILVKMGRTDEAIAMFKKVLAIDPKSRFALTSLGYASRSAGDDLEAERLFEQLKQNYPGSYVPFLALGDLYTARHDFTKAQASYERGFALAPRNSLLVAGGMNASIESHNIPLAGGWQQRVTEKMAATSQILREEERYFSFKGDAQRSAEIGRKAIALIPRDRDVVIYLGYDLLKLKRWDELESLVSQYQEVFPREPDIPLLTGYVNKQAGHLQRAVGNFTEALNRDSNVVTAYTNRGFIYNDLHQPAKAAADFEEALKREPRNFEAHMGLAFAELNLHHWHAAIQQTQLAEEISGDSELIHIIRATAYGRQGLLTKSAAEYTAALKFDPNDGSLLLGIGNIYFAQRRYREAIVELGKAAALLPDNAQIYALRARANASVQNREEALNDIRLAEDHAAAQPLFNESGLSDTEALRTKTLNFENSLGSIYLSTGQAFSLLGDQAAAMERFSKALVAPQSDRVGVRLAIAQLMADQDHAADAERQMALAQMEAVAGDTAPPTNEQYIQAANTLQFLHEYELSEAYLVKARAAGALDSSVRIGLANSYLGLGETRRAAAELAAVKQTDDNEIDYQYLLAEASLYQQQHLSTQALNSFAAAASAAGEDQTAERNLLQLGADEGFRLTRKVSLLSNLNVQPIFEDSTVYVLDSKLNSPNGPVPVANADQLPPPRSSIETSWINSFHLHLDHLPTNSGFFQIRNARGTISVPATATVQRRSTTDYSFNFGLNPTFQAGSNSVTLSSGFQATIRRDSLSPVQLNQNLFRVFTYASTSPLFNAVSASGYISAEVGPFTDTPINEHAIAGAINFRVGSPWGKTALLTGWGANDQRFDSSKFGDSRNYNTTSYIGLSRRFSTRFSAEAMLEDLRAFRIVPFSPIHSAISQALRPAAIIDFALNRNWDFQASSSYESARGFHGYDLLQNGVEVSYTRPFDRSFNDRTGEIHLKYPIRFSGGLREETFPNFTRGTGTQIRPYVSITIF